MKIRFRFLFFLPLVIAVGVGTTVGLLFAQFEGLPDVQDLEQYRPSTITKIYDWKKNLLAEFYVERRIVVPLHRIPKHLVEATLAIEDNHFYDHIGIDFKGLIRASYRNLRAGRVVQGGSTITQQLAKVLFLTPERSLARKVKEALLALRIERAYSKEEILALYFNQIYLGSGAYGVEAAARTYFDKGVENISLGEAALLAALPKAPSYLSPFRYHGRALRRRNLVLSRMQRLGFVSEEQAREAISAPLILVAQKPLDASGRHFVEHVRRELQEMFGNRGLYRKGLRVHTTLDLGLQRAARAGMLKGLTTVDRRRGFMRRPDPPLGDSLNPLPAVGTQIMGKVSRIGEEQVFGVFGGLPMAMPIPNRKWAKNLTIGDSLLVQVESVDLKKRKVELRPVARTEGGLIALDVKTGAIRAMVGGRNFKSSEFNRAIQAQRQPGSAFKPFIYAAALKKGFRPNDILIDAPVSYWDPVRNKMWKPTNYEKRFFGRVTLQRSLEHSINVATIRLLERVGARKAVELVKRLGIRSPIEPYLSMALGTSVVSLLEMVSAYATLANSGLRAEPYTIQRVETADGRTLFEREAHFSRAIDAKTAYLMTHMMQGVIERGTGRKAKVLDAALAGKTGTTDAFKDAWFIGFSPSLALGVWVGLDNNESLGRGETGARAALPIWIDAMGAWTRKRQSENFTMPPDIRIIKVDSRTGFLVAAPCRRFAIWIAIKKGTEPQRTCSALP